MGIVGRWLGSALRAEAQLIAFSAATVRFTVRRLMLHGETQHGAARIRAEIAAMPAIEDAVQMLERLAADLPLTVRPLTRQNCSRREASKYDACPWRL